MALIICFFYPLSLGEAPDGDHTLKEKLLGLGLKSAVILAGTLVCLFFTLQWGGSVYPWSDSLVWGCLLGFGLLLIVFLISRYDKRRSDCPSLLFHAHVTDIRVEL